LRAAETKDREKYDRQQDQANRKADSLAKAFCQINAEDDKEDRKAD
jgi:hypothetical protein